MERKKSWAFIAAGASGVLAGFALRQGRQDDGDPPPEYRISSWAGRRGPVSYEGDGGPVGQAKLFHPSGVAFGPIGDLYIADSNNDAIRRVSRAGVITTVAGGNGLGDGGDGGPARDAQLHRPTDIALDQAGNLYIADRDNHRIRRVDTAGTIATIAGGNGPGFGGDGGRAIKAQLSHPRGIAVDEEANVYFTDRHNNAVRRIDQSGGITTIAGGQRSGLPG